MTSFRTVIIIATAAIASLLEIIDSSIVNVAIPTMMGNLGATLDEISWVTTGYMIANSIVLPIAAWLGSQLGRKRYFTGAIILFTLASFACGMANHLTLLIFFRVIQGIAGGALLPTSQTLIQEQFPKEKAGMAMAIFGMSVMVGPALGPVLGGYLTDQFGWRSIFNVNVPMGCLAALLSWMYVDNLSETTKKTSVDWIGLALLCLGVGCLQFILERGEVDGWDSQLILVCGVSAVLGVVGFVVWELHSAEPIMNLRLFRYNVLQSGTLLMLCLGIMLYALTFVIPIFVSRMIPQMSATQTGALFMPGSIATAIFMVPVGLMLSYISPKILVLIGLSLGGCAVFLMTQWTALTGAEDILIPLIIRGSGMAFLFVPINQMVLGSFRGEELGQVAGMQNFFRQLGGSIGIASLDTYLTRFGAQNYVDQMSVVNALNPVAYQNYVQSMQMPAMHLNANLGHWTPETLAVKNLYYRVGQQVFLLSFEQLCWLIMGVLALGLLPLYWIQPQKNAHPVMMSH